MAWFLHEAQIKEQAYMELTESLSRIFPQLAGLKSSTTRDETSATSNNRMRRSLVDLIAAQTAALEKQIEQLNLELKQAKS